MLRGNVFVSKVYNGVSKAGKNYTMLKCIDMEAGEPFGIFVPQQKIELAAGIMEMAENDIEIAVTNRGVSLVAVHI